MMEAGRISMAKTTANDSASPADEKANGRVDGEEPGWRSPTMKKAWPARNAARPGMKRFRGSISNTSPTRQNANATTNHPRRPPETVSAAGMRAVAATSSARTAGLAAY
jgi:hypothetical protein